MRRLPPVALCAVLVLTAACDRDALSDGRERRYVHEVKLTLDSALATAQQWALISQGGWDELALDFMEEAGLAVEPGVRVDEVIGTVERFCVSVTHTKLPEDHPWRQATLASDTFEPSTEDDC
jgi:hypothetical protein